MHIDFARIIDAGYTRIMPLHGKHPFTPGLPRGSWKPLRNEQPDDALVKRWQKDYDEKKEYTTSQGEIITCNGAGLITGPEVGVGLFDYDCLDSFPELIEVIERLVPGLSDIKRIGLAPKWGSFFKVTDSYLSRPKIFLKNGNLIEIKCEGGYAVLDSIHPDTGEAYFWIDGNHLIDNDKEKLPALPENLWDELIFTAKKYGYWAPKQTIRENDKVIREIRKPLRNGKRAEHGAHNTLREATLKLIGKKTPTHIGAEMIYQLDQDKHQPLPYFCDKSRGTDGSDPDPRVNAKRFYESHENTIKEISPKKELVSEHTQNFYAITEKGLSPKYKELAEFVKEKYDAVTDDFATYLYRKTHYVALSDQALEAMIYKMTGGIGSPAHITGFLRFIRASSYQKEFFDIPNNGSLNLSNGYLDIRTKKIVSHEPSHRQLVTLPIAFDAAAKCPLFDKFLNEIFMGNGDLIELVREMFGYVLLGGNPFLQKAFVLHGTGHNGKSTLIEIMQGLIGSNNFSSVSLKNLDKPFSVVMLHNKIVNLTDETPKESINPEAFKAAVGGGHLIAAKKGQDEFQMPCRTRFIFACNTMPKMHDSTVGMLRRLVFIPFDYYIPDESRDPDISEKLKAELPGILNWALVGAERLLIFGRLTDVAAVQELKEEYKKESDNTYEFFCEFIKLDPNGFIAKDVLYNKYKDWALKEGVQYTVQQKILTLRIREYAKSLARKQGQLLDKTIFADTCRGSEGNYFKVMQHISFK